MTLQLESEQIMLPGLVLPDEDSCFQERDDFDAQMIADVLEGKPLGVVFRDFVSPENYSVICRNFWEHPSPYSRGDAVPVEYIRHQHVSLT